MTELDEAPGVDVPARAFPGRSRLFWTVTALGIAAILLVCTALILFAAMRS
jgi:hypothetical protein